MTKQKVLLVISNLEFGGAQRQIVELVNNMDKARFEVHLCSLSDYVPLVDQISSQVTMHIINKKTKFDLAVVYQLIKLIRQHRFQVIHSYLFDAEIAGRVSGRLSLTGIKVIGSERNTDYKLKRVQRIAYSITRNMVDLVVANSRAGAKFNEQLTGVSNEKYRVVYNGVDINKFKPAEKNAIRKELGIDTEITLVGMFASFKQQKNHPFLLSAVKRLVQRYGDMRILFVGDMLYGGMHGSDQYHEMIKEMIKELGLEDICISIGNRNDVERIYPACDFTVLPSLFEGTPNVLLESMACGVPVVATRVSDNELIVAENETGFVVDLNNIEQMCEAMEKLLESQTLRQQFGINARKRMEEQFSTKKLAENLQAIYSSR